MEFDIDIMDVVIAAALILVLAIVFIAKAFLKVSGKSVKEGVVTEIRDFLTGGANEIKEYLERQSKIEMKILSIIDAMTKLHGDEFYNLYEKILERRGKDYNQIKGTRGK